MQKKYSIDNKIDSSVNSQCLSLSLTGLVQGIGMRPALYRFAKSQNLNGLIQNLGSKVLLQLEGNKSNLDYFAKHFINHIPKESIIHSKKIQWQASKGFRDLTISSLSEKKITLFASLPDTVPCQLCLDEFFDLKNRRYLYPFHACTQCGPRYTILKSFPYDRDHTTMRDFPICKKCTEEFRNQNNRRFHAENITCAHCGPELTIYDSNKNRINLNNPYEQINWIVDKLEHGSILALKGVGGYQLLCHGHKQDTIKTLRYRKQRPHQAFALMTDSTDHLMESPFVTQQLKSPAGPIVLLEHTYELPFAAIAPDSQKIAVMLPSSLLHHYLFGAKIKNTSYSFLVVTSANISGEPMIIDDQEAFLKLNGIADFYVTHNRQIAEKCDDSVLNIQGTKETVWRRARGYAPGTINVKYKTPIPCMALGGDLKNTVCIYLNDQANVSPHLGSLSYLGNFKAFKEKINAWSQVGVKIKHKKAFPHKSDSLLIAIDKHPGYLSSEWGRSLSLHSCQLVIEVQHHVAHGASLLAEHLIDEAIILAFDGSGFGERDDLNISNKEQTSIWGGECLYMNLQTASYKRMATISSSTLLGNDKAIREPGIQLAARLFEIGIEPAAEYTKIAELAHLYSKSSSMGRLFDSVSGLLLPQKTKISYEGEAAIALESLAQKCPDKKKLSSYPISWCKDFTDEIDSKALFKAIYLDYIQKIPCEQIAYRFHLSIADIGLLMVKRASEVTLLKKVGLTGGVFQNKLLTELLQEKLSQIGLKVLTHRFVPPGDGGISLGQAVFAAQYYKNNAV